MSLNIIECEQGSEEWHRARLGIPTASMFATVMAKGKGADSQSRGLTSKEYMRKLAGEIITGEPMENYTNAHMERGKVMEAEARTFYEFMDDAALRRVGFIVNGPKGCSPDSLVGDNGMVEIKTKLPHLLIELLDKDDFPPEHKAQCQGGLWIAEREWIDIAIYWPKLPLFVKRAYRDEAYIANLAGEVRRFNDELHEMVARVRAYGGQRAVAA